MQSGLAYAPLDVERGADHPADGAAATASPPSDGHHVVRGVDDASPSPGTGASQVLVRHARDGSVDPSEARASTAELPTVTPTQLPLPPCTWCQHQRSTARLRVALSLAAVCFAAALFAVVWVGAQRHPSSTSPPPPTPDTMTVQDAVNATGCSTFVLAGLSVQMVQATNAVAQEEGFGDRLFASLAGLDGVDLTKAAGAVPYLQEAAVAGLVAAIDMRRAVNGSEITMRVNSALRTIAQQVRPVTPVGLLLHSEASTHVCLPWCDPLGVLQLLLYRWYKMGACGITLAAKPGHSNHNSGLSIDIDSAYEWQVAMEAHGWKKLGDFDRMHYNYVGPGGRDVRSVSVLAFQQLWNCNVANARAVATDGVYGPETEAALLQAPVDGLPRLCWG